MKKTRILIADDHSVVRDGVANIIRRTADLELVGEAASGQEAVALVLDQGPDAAILDLDMPGGGLELVARVHALRPDLRILVLSQHAEREFAQRAIEAGARGYVGKEAGIAEIGEAIHRVATGRRYLSEEAQELMLARASGDELPVHPHERLSTRELEVALRIARGQRVGKIAEDLGLSFRTVSTHRVHALEKLGLATNAELTLYAREHGLI